MGSVYIFVVKLVLFFQLRIGFSMVVLISKEQTKIIRGGAALLVSGFLCCVLRGFRYQDNQGNDLGFRVCYVGNNQKIR